MKSMNIIHRSGKAAFVIVALLLLQNLFTMADARESWGAAADFNISAEARELERFDDALFKFSQQILNLSKKAKLTGDDIASVRSSANEIKNQIPSAQRNFRSALQKMNASQQWGETEKKVIARIKNREILSALNEAGGARKLWEDVANNLSSLAQEVDANVQNLSRRLQSRSFSSEDELRTRATRVAHRPAPVFKKSLRCRIATAVLTVKFLIDSTVIDETDVAIAQAACGILEPATN